jgi:hypothetical protein
MLFSFTRCWRIGAMMGERTGTQGVLFYRVSLERHVPPDHMLRSIDRFVDIIWGLLHCHRNPSVTVTRNPKVVFVGMIQWLAGPGGPNVQDASQRAVAGSFGR